jgi:hypothetical protein
MKATANKARPNRCVAVMLMTTVFAATGFNLSAAEIKLMAPLDYQVVQRTSRAEGTIPIGGMEKDLALGRISWQARLAADAHSTEWRPLKVKVAAGRFSGWLAAPAGGWWRLEVRVMLDGKTIADTAVEHVGIGEVFVVAGQSNSANHGEERQCTQTKRVAVLGDRKWQLADDPMAGASGQGGSFMPPLGDELVRRFNVPIGFIACGIGATSVREWLPKGTTFPNPPTIEQRVEKLPRGDWASNGEAYTNLIDRIKSVGPHGFRAVLWHQGESDANQQDPARTLSVKSYREYLQQLIRESRREIGWDAPWFVAQVSYHIPGDEASLEIRAAQASLWRDHIAMEGPDSDALKGLLRDSGGKGVHFSGPGLREHGKRWAEKVGAWLQTRLTIGSDEEGKRILEKVVH